MNLLQLKYFNKLAETEHYGKTAKMLDISQSALSNSISRLEKELNVSLFKREGRNVRLTKCGLEFNSHLTNSLRSLDEAVECTKKYRNGGKKIIKIAAVNSVEREFIPTIIRSFKQNNSDIGFDVYQKNTYEALAGLSKGLYDVVFCSRSIYANEFEFVPVKIFNLVAAVNENSIFASRNSISLKELVNFNVASYRSSCILHEFLKGLFKEYNLDVRESFDDEIGAASLVSCNKSTVAIVLDTVRDIPFPNYKTLPISELNEGFHLVCCVNDPNRVSDEETNKFLKFIKDEVRIKNFNRPLEDKFWMGL